MRRFQRLNIPTWAQVNLDQVDTWEAVSRNSISVTEFKYSAEIGRVFRGYDQLRWLVNWGQEWGFLPSQHALGISTIDIDWSD